MDDVLPATIITHSDGLPVIDQLQGNGMHQEDVVENLPNEFYSSFLTEQSKSRLPSPIRGLLPLELTPGIISLLAGKPNPTTFPITSISFTARTPIGKSEFEQNPLTIEGSRLDDALQYGPTAGDPSLIDWLAGLQEKSHRRKRGSEWSITVGGGSQDLLYKGVLALVSPGDSVLVEAPVYGGVVPLFQVQHAESIEIETDRDGASASSMRKCLENWPTNKPKPKVFYTVPYGCNPSGVTASAERKKEIIALAREHNFLILEDDPYFYLYFSDKPRPPSYFELDARGPGPCGRVLRFDSFSKILSSGLRLGVATGPVPLIKAINLHTASANLQASSTTQVMAATLLNHWGYETFFEHTRRVSEFYRGKRDTFELSMSKHLKGLAEWETPEAGMFFWFKLLLPPTEGAPEGDSEQLIRSKAFEAGVLALPGTSFFAAGRATPYVWASFSLLDEADLNEALRRLASVLRV